MSIRLLKAISLAAAFAVSMFSQVTPPGYSRANGTYRGLQISGAGGQVYRCGGYPLGHSMPAMLYDCNGTTAQDMTLVPFRTPIDSTVEIRAQGRCLGVAPPVLNIGEAPIDLGIFPLPPAAGWRVVLEPCDGTTLQWFYAPQVNGIFPMNNLRSYTDRRQEQNRDNEC